MSALRILRFATTVVAFLAAAGILAQRGGDSYRAEIAKWRQSEEANLRKEDGWLSVAGLFWLNEGYATIGSAPTSDIVLPAPAPPKVGAITRLGEQVMLEVEPLVIVTVGGKARASFDLKSDAKGAPDEVKIGRLTLTVIERGRRIGIRLFDPDSKARKSFTGRRWYPVDARYRIRARFVPYKPAKKMTILNVLGDTRQADCPGYVEFTVRGKKVRLDAEDAGSGLFFNFRDGTSGRTTYPAGRFLDAARP